MAQKDKSGHFQVVCSLLPQFGMVAGGGISRFEQETSFCPLYLAWRILDEARDYFRTPIPEAFADQLAHRAEAVFARHPFWARKAAPRAGARQQFEYRRQREFILISMRHWLAGVLAKERPVLFRDLPKSFKVGHPLPQKQGGAAEFVPKVFLLDGGEGQGETGWPESTPRGGQGQ